MAGIEADPSAYRFTDGKDQAAPGPPPADDTYDASRAVPDTQQYLFWDTLHPTTAGHALGRRRRSRR